MPQPEGQLPQVVKKKEGHMPELRKRRSHLALLGVFAMVASVLAVGAPSVTAEAGKADAAATYSACVGPATADVGFTDVATGSTHDAAVNCIAYYGITRGTTATTFAPNQTISRWQLAVMLQRAAGPAGVTLPAVKDMGFTDISGLAASFRDAINQMAELGVMTGTTATTFDPSGIVSRGIIVEALAGFLTNARVGPGGKALSRGLDRSLTVKQDASANATSITIDESFRDIGAVSFSTYQAVRALAEMGVVQGRSDGTFGPAASVTRAQAAAFITRALAHTNARPAGLTMQVENTAVAGNVDFDLSISVRDDDFAPIDSTSVDVFMYPVRNSATAFKPDGTCNTGSGGVAAAGGGTAMCSIELDDEVTEPDGNVLVTPGRITENTVYWAWNGDIGTSLDWDVAQDLSMDNSAVSKAASLTMTTVVTPSEARVSTSVSSDAKDAKTVRYGTTVTVTIQLVDGNGNDVGIAGQSYSWWAEGTHAPTGPSRRLSDTGTKTVTTDSTGKATFTLTQSDPDTVPTPTGGQTPADEDPGADDMTTWEYNIAKVGNAVDVVNNAQIGFMVTGSTGSGEIIFDDDDGKAESVRIELQRFWTSKPSGGAVARVGVTGKVTDQYGNALRNQAIFFDLDGNDRFGCDNENCDNANTDIPVDSENRPTGDTIRGTTRRLTRSNGTNVVSATFGTNTPDLSVYRVAADINGDNDVADPGEQADANHFWADGPFGFNSESGSASSTPASSGVAGLGHGGLVSVDLDNNALVIISRWPSITGYRVYRYTDATIFRWFVGSGTYTADEDAASDDTNGVPLVRWLTAEAFEARMAKHLERLGQRNVETGSMSSAMGVFQYNTKSGSTVMSVRLDPGSSATANEAIIQDPPSSAG